MASSPTRLRPRMRPHTAQEAGKIAAWAKERKRSDYIYHRGMPGPVVIRFVPFAVESREFTLTHQMKGTAVGELPVQPCRPALQSAAMHMYMIYMP